MGVSTAMIMAAGLGTRMHPLTLETPKPLIPFRGKTLLDYALEGLKAHGIKTLVINTHYLAPLMHQHVSRHHPEVILSHEIERLESGGGIKAALHHFIGETVMVVNPDVLYTCGLQKVLEDLESAWKPEEMDGLLTLCPQEKCHSFFGKGDYDFEGVSLPPKAGAIKWRGNQERSDYFMTGARLVKIAPYRDVPEEYFSDKKIWDSLENQGRLSGVVIEGEAFDLSSVPGLAYALEHFPHE